MLTIEDVRNAKSCEDIFIDSEDAIKKAYRTFVRKYHPDVYKEEDLTDIISKINNLYEEALDKLGKHIWKEKNIIEFNATNHKKYQLKYLGEYSFELGQFYIGRNHVIYVLNSDKRKYFDNAIRAIGSIRYANADMEKNFKMRMPTIDASFELTDGRFALVFKKTTDVFLLEDLVKYFKDKKSNLNERHCAWIINRLCSIACLFQYNGIVHNGISLNNMYVSPLYHSIMPIGGWWYCVPNGEKMIGTQREIYDLMPVKEKSEKIATFKTDMESIKLIGRQLNPDVPEPMRNWLNKASTGDAFKEISEWNKVIIDSFGAKKFVELLISEKDIYNI